MTAGVHPARQKRWEAKLDAIMKNQEEILSALFFRGGSHEERVERLQQVRERNAAANKIGRG